MEFLTQKRALSRIDVYMNFLKEFCGKEVYDITDKDVLNYLVFKDVNNSGRTIIHHKSCPFLGSQTLQQCRDSVKCAHRHAAHSMRIGIILKLRKAFMALMFLPVLKEIPQDPISQLVQNYLSFKFQEQGESGVLP